jgi:diguanylate cyclase (GGDEF)-like protein/PAS domain S-box-containing protein
MIKALSTAILSYLIEESTDAVLIMDELCRVRYINAAMSRLSGYGAGELMGESLNGLLPDEVATQHDSYVENYLEGSRDSTVLGRVRELQLRHRTGEIIPIELKAVDLGTAAGTRYFGAFLVDLRRRRTIEAQNAALIAQLEQQALTDALTGVPNRRAFDLEAARVIALAKREGWPVALGIVDVDHFKKVNDQHGHAIGDTVLCNVARAIQNALRAGDLFVRIGGEEFGLFLPHATLAQAAAIAERVRNQIAENPIAVTADLRINVTISIGVAALTLDSSLDAALAQADAALYQAKLMGRNRIVVAQS